MITDIVGHAHFTDGPYDVLPRPPLSGGEVLVMAFPPGVYRLETGPDGVRLFRRDLAAATTDAVPVTTADIAKKQAAFWSARTPSK